MENNHILILLIIVLIGYIIWKDSASTSNSSTKMTENESSHSPTSPSTSRSTSSSTLASEDSDANLPTECIFTLNEHNDGGSCNPGKTLTLTATEEEWEENENLHDDGMGDKISSVTIKKLGNPNNYCSIRFFKNSLEDNGGDCSWDVVLPPGETSAVSRHFNGDAGDKASAAVGIVGKFDDSEFGDHFAYKAKTGICNSYSFSDKRCHNGCPLKNINNSLCQSLD